MEKKLFFPFFLIIHVINAIMSEAYFERVFVLHMLSYSYIKLFSVSIVFNILHVMYQKIIRDI